VSAGQVITIRGEGYLLLEDVADCYRVEVRWLTEAYNMGLIGEGEEVQSSHAIPVSRLGLVARVVRWRMQTGVDLMGLAALVEPEE
jgi:hypothetical protein